MQYFLLTKGCILCNQGAYLDVVDWLLHESILPSPEQDHYPEFWKFR